MYDPTGHQPGAVPSRVLTALRGETKRLDAPVVTGAQVAAPPVTHALTLSIDGAAAIDAIRAAFKGGGPLRRPKDSAGFRPEDLRRGDTLIYDRSGKLVRYITPDAARSIPEPVDILHVGGNTEAAPADLATAPSPERRTLLLSLSPAERAQDRAEACLTDLTAAVLSRGSDPAAHAQRMPCNPPTAPSARR